MRILFMGAGAFGLPTLRAVADPSSAHELVGVVTQLDRPAGRGQALTPTPIGAWCGSDRPALPLLKSTNVNTEAERAWIDELRPDLLLVIAFGQKIGPAVIGERPAINLHASLLPRWRGAAPIHAAILAGDHETGNSVITLADRMDAGLVLGQSRRVIEPEHTTGVLHDLLAEDGPALVHQVIADIARHGVRGQTQDEALVTKAKKLSKDDAWVDFTRPADECRNRVHGLNPWPGVTVTHRGHPLKLIRVAAEQSVSGSAEPGTILEHASGVVRCGAGTGLRMLEVQPAGGRAMPWSAYAAGRAPAPGERLIGKP